MLELQGELNIADFEEVIFRGKSISLRESTLNEIKSSFDFLKDFSENKIIYGVNTGFGPMAQYKVKDQERIELQYNLIRSHSSGMGNPIDPQYVRAAMLARLNTLSLGKSGVHSSVIELMIALLNRNIVPLIPEHGGVGASGDLVQLAHLALVLIGEGEVFYEGQLQKTETVFKKEKIQPVEVKLREGLALMNGTSVMTGVGLVNVLHAKRIMSWMIKASAAINEIVKAYDDHLSEALNHSKKHAGQQEIAEKMRTHLSDSQLIRKREHHLYHEAADVVKFEEKIQEYYSLRCVPQILGPVLDTLNKVEEVLINEVNSANDNPIVDVDNKNVYHGGNFHGDYVSLEMDKLKIVVTKMTMLAERQLNYLFNDKLNAILPPFINRGKLGLNYGMQGIQFTATSTTAESQMLSNPMYVHSIPTNNDNQDIVSMGTNAALIASKIVENSFQVVAIELIAIVEAIEYLELQDKVSSATRAMYDEIRDLVPAKNDGDGVWYLHAKKVKDYLKNNIE
jgi:histidine ammonia-lyase